MRRLGHFRKFAFAAALTLGAPVAVALAQEGVPGTGSMANEGHEPTSKPHGELHCTAESGDEECLEYWESHINWFSWDYKAPYADPSHRHMPPPFAFALINFAVFAFILYRLAAQPLKDFVRTRHTTIRKDLDEAARLHTEADTKLREYDAKIAGLDAEITTLLAQVRSEAETEKARIIASAETEAVRLKADAEAQIAREIAEVRRALKAEAVAQAVALAEQLILQKANEGDQVKLTERFVADLERAAPLRS